MVERFPSEPLHFVVCAVLTDGLGEMGLELTIQRLDVLEEIYQRSLAVRFTNPLQEVRCVFWVRDCSFPVPGYYQAMLLADNQLVAQKRIHITAKEST